MAAPKKNQTRTPKAQPAPAVPEGVTITIPQSSAVVVVGVSTNGQLYHQVLGPNVGLIEVAGLHKYLGKVVDIGFERSMTIGTERTDRT